MFSVAPVAPRLWWHDIYMGFGIFLRLVKWPSAVPNINILGTMHSDDPATLHELISTSKGVIGMANPKAAPTAMTSTLSVAAGSAAQLPCVEAELKSKPSKPATCEEPFKATILAKPAKPAKHVSSPGPARPAKTKPSAKPIERQKLTFQQSQPLQKMVRHLSSYSV